jgi:hypothetical protein
VLLIVMFVVALTDAVSLRTRHQLAGKVVAHDDLAAKLDALVEVQVGGESISGALEAANALVSGQQETETGAITATTDESKEKLGTYEGNMEENLSSAKEMALTRLKVTENLSEDWMMSIEGRLQSRLEQAQTALQQAKADSDARIQAKAEELEERFKAAEQLASIEREQNDASAMTRLQTQLDLAAAEKKTLEMFVARADAKVQLAEQMGQTQLNGKIVVSDSEKKQLDADEEQAEKMGADIEKEHNTVVHDAVIETAQMQAQTQKQLETLRHEKEEKLAEAKSSSTHMQTVEATHHTESALAASMFNMQNVANLQGRMARRPLH